MLISAGVTRKLLQILETSAIGRMGHVGSSYDIHPYMRPGSKSFANDNGNGNFQRKFSRKRKQTYNSLERKNTYIYDYEPEALKKKSTIRMRRW